MAAEIDIFSLPLSLLIDRYSSGDRHHLSLSLKINRLGMASIIALKDGVFAPTGILKELEEDKISITDRSYWTKRIHALCAIEPNVDEALRLLDRLRLRGYRLDSLNLSSSIHALCDSHRFSEAHRRLLLSLASHSLPDHRTSNVLLARLLDADTPQLTLRVVDCMISAIPHFVPSLTNYNRLIDQLCSILQLVDAHRVFVEMSERGHAPKVISCTTLINGFCKIGELDTARQLFDEMLAKGVRRNSLMYSVLLRGILRKRRFEEGRELMCEIWQRMLDEENSGVNHAAFVNLVDVLCREGLFHEVFRIAEEMPQGNVSSPKKLLLLLSREMVIGEKELDMMEDHDKMPHLVYVRREKRPTNPHNFKAGALNVLLRVSSLLSNGSYILVLDCDMYSNDPTSAKAAMCFHLDPTSAKTAMKKAQNGASRWGH